MTPETFIRKWGDSTLRERQGAQEHFIDLCRLLGEPTPAEDDPFGDRFCFERGAEKAGGGDGWADVWRRNCFGWEYKGKHKDLRAALRQLQAYALDLQNPPYLVVCDMERIVVHTNWTNSVSRRLEFGLDDLHEPAKLDQLRDVFRGSERLRPGISPQQLTHDAAERFGTLGRRLQERGHDPRAVAHFLNRVVFCLFAEHAGLLPGKLFTRMIKGMQVRPRLAKAQFEALFATMGAGGFFGADVVLWFNGGLFDDAGALPLDYEDFRLIADSAAEHDWAEIDPAIFGTLFEEALKAERKRAALGAHYTDRDKILKIVEPVVTRPLLAEWDRVAIAIRAATEDARAAAEERRAAMARVAATLDAAGAEAVLEGERRAVAAGSANLELFEDAGASRLPGAAGRALKRAQPELTALARRRTLALNRARDLRDAFLDRLAGFRVLDPACGSGNFLYVALHALRDIELRALMDAERLGVPQVPPRVTLKNFYGIEVEPYAAELARVTLWIGDLQWKRKNGYTAYAEPVLETLDGIENRDALLNPDGTEAAWPEVDVIVGNPPFLGGKKMRAGLGDAAVERLFAAYKGRVPAEADFVCYWVEKAWRAMGGAGRRAGLVTTNSVRGGASRRVLEPIAAAGALREAWADEPWVLDGAAVRVSMLGFGDGFGGYRLDGADVERINADLTSTQIDYTKSLQLSQNRNIAFQGPVKVGSFDIDGFTARLMLKAPTNPNGQKNEKVLLPLITGGDIVHRNKDQWIIDFYGMSEVDAQLFEAPFRHVIVHVKPKRDYNADRQRREKWWLLGRSGGDWKRKSSNLLRCIVTSRVAKHRTFRWQEGRFLPDSRVCAIATNEECIFGVLSSKTHELWSLQTCSWHGVGNDPTYNSESCFETFPFPEGLTPNLPASSYADDPRAVAIASAAAELDRLREAWLNPPDLVRIEPEVVPGYPDRVLPRDAAAAAELKKRTLTNLYNARPAWLDHAHRRLDAAVAAAYGWPADLSDDAVLDRLFALNQERAAAGR